MFPALFRATGKSFGSIIAGLWVVIIIAVYLMGLSLSAAISNYSVAVWFLLGSVYLFIKCPETTNKTPVDIFPEFSELEDLLIAKHANLEYGSCSKE